MKRMTRTLLFASTALLAGCFSMESGGTTGKTIIGERKQRRDVKWKAEAKKKVLSDYHEYFDLQPKENAYKQNTKELKAKPKQMHDEFYN